MMRYNALRAEIDGNIGLYGAMTDIQVATELAAVDKLRNRTVMTRQEIYSQIEDTALEVLTAIQLAHLDLALADTVNPFDTNLVKVFTNIFGAGSATITALTNARVETVSKAVMLGLKNTSATSLVGWVTMARSL